MRAGEGSLGLGSSPGKDMTGYNFVKPWEKWELALRNCWEKQTRFTHPQIGWTRAVTYGCICNPQVFVMLGEKRGWKLSPCGFALQTLNALLTLDTAEWDGRRWDEMEMKQKNSILLTWSSILCWLRKKFWIQSFILPESQETSFLLYLTYCPFPKVISKSSCTI